MAATKPAFDPNKPFQAAPQEKPAFDPNRPFQPADAQAAKPAFDPNKPFQAPPDPMTAGKAAAVSGENGVLLGLRPVVAGVGAAAGNLVGQYESGQGVDFSKAKDAFVEGRRRANVEQTKASEEHPYISGASNFVGSIPSIAFLPAKGLAGAVKLGAGLGAAQAAGSANSLGEAGVDVGLGGALGGAAYGAGKATAILSKVEHVFGKTNNPVNEHIVSGLEEYKSQFQFPKDSVIEKQLNSLIARVKSTPPSQLTEKDLDGIVQRLGPEILHESVQAGENKLSEIAGLIGSKAANAMSGAVEKYGPGLLKVAEFGAGALGFHYGGPGMASAAYLGTKAMTNPKTYEMAGKAIGKSAELTQKLANTFGINPTTQEGLTTILQTPEAKEILLHYLLEKEAEPPKMSNTIRRSADLKGK